MQNAVSRGQSQVFILNLQKAHASNTVVTDTLFIDKVQARVLFDSRATHLFTSPYFANKLARDKTLMKDPLAIGTPLGKSIEVRYMYPRCVIEIRERILSVDLIELVVFDFDVIIRID